MPSASGSCFVDTNILLYAHDLAASDKRVRAREWILALSEIDALIISPQVMNEFCSVVQRKMPDIPPAEIDLLLAAMERWCGAETSAATARLGFALQMRYRLGFYDAVLVASAVRASCSHFLTEDLNDGQVIEGVRIINPFLREAGDLRASD